MSDSIKLGISACLLGQEVRYNGGHQLDRYLADTVGAFVEYVPVCPEVGAGMGIPREPVRLVGDVRNPRIVGRKSGEDWTGRMRAWAEKELDRLEQLNLCGFVFKAKSPSSGMARVKVYPPEGGQPRYDGRGFFAGMFQDRFPLLPVEDDGRLHDAGLRENFLTRIFTMKRWRDMVGEKRTTGALVDFHTRHKLLLMACSVEAYRRLGKLVAHAREMEQDALFKSYLEQLLSALKLRTTVKKNVNVLQHILGYFKKDLGADEKRECLELIDAYHKELVPLIVPVTLLNHHVRKYGKDYLAKQVYLHPHPLELRLRNHV
ncbi:YbgA family protein [Salidesulfovibrio onnuriiensis]|uniref:YbgA family protein n=1 Tax=Salidesulfovibrio onnuriiensis TaxID=2583823 RepID=UPI0011C7674D|nr:DUF523 and DUF1722 domain-containing protein [Salidesulfovibrio onnuriiensis]